MSEVVGSLRRRLWRRWYKSPAAVIVVACLLVTAPQRSFSMSYKAQEQFKASFRKGFLMTCEPTIKSQFERTGLSAFVSLEKRVAYCTCVSIKIFDDLNTLEIEFINAKGELPPRKKQAREGYSSECFDSEIGL